MKLINIKNLSTRFLYLFLTYMPQFIEFIYYRIYIFRIYKASQTIMRSSIDDSDNKNELTQICMKQCKVIEKMFCQFKMAYENRSLQINQFMTYVKNVQELTKINCLMMRNFWQQIPRKQSSQALQNIEYLVTDHSSKTKQILNLLKQSSQKQFQFRKHQKQQSTCERCFSDIRKINIEQIQTHLQNEYLGTLDRMLLQAKIQINDQLFSQQQDKLFFKQLHSNLKKKHQNLNFNSKSIESLIEKICKDIAQMNLMKKMSIQESKDIQSPNYQWMKNIQTSLNELLQIQFKKKLPSFIESMLGTYEKYFKQLNYKQKTDSHCQTFDYQSVEINEYKQKLMKLNGRIFKLQNQTKWYEKQVEIKNQQLIQTNKNVKLQREEIFNQLIAEKENNKKLQFTLTNFNKQLEVIRQQNMKKSEKQNWLKRKISKVQKEKLQMEIQAIKKQSISNQREDQSSNKSISLQDKQMQPIHETDSIVQSIINNSLLKTKMKTKTPISRLTLKQSKSKYISSANPFQSLLSTKQMNPILQQNIQRIVQDIRPASLALNQNNKFNFSNEKQSIKKQQLVQEDKNCQNQQRKKLQNLQCFDKNIKENQTDYQMQDYSKNLSPKGKQLKLHQKFMVSQGLYNQKVKMVNLMMQQRLKQSGILCQRRNSKQDIFKQSQKYFDKRSEKRIEKAYQTYNKLPSEKKSDNNVGQFGSIGQKSSADSMKKMHFRSQTVLNNLKMKQCDGFATNQKKNTSKYDNQVSLNPLDSRNSNYQSEINLQHKAELKAKPFFKLKSYKSNEYQSEIQRQWLGLQDKIACNIQELTDKLERAILKKNSQILTSNISEQMKKIVISWLNKCVRQQSNLNNCNQEKQRMQKGIQNDQEYDKENQKQSSTAFQRKANKSVSFFEGKQEGLEKKIKNQEIQINEQELQRKVELNHKVSLNQEKRFPITYSSCFNTPNRMRTDQNKQKKQILRRSLPNQTESNQNQFSLHKKMKTRPNQSPNYPNINLNYNKQDWHSKIKSKQLSRHDDNLKSEQLSRHKDNLKNKKLLRHNDDHWNNSNQKDSTRASNYFQYQKKFSNTLKSSRLQILTRQDLQELFLSEKNAYIYQCNHMKSCHKNQRLIIKSQSQQNWMGKVFTDLKQIEIQNKSFYEQIIAFIRYPYQTIMGNYRGASLIKGIKIDSFFNFMERILYFHRSCKPIRSEGFCQHIELFQRKIDFIKRQVDIQIKNKQQKR